MLRRGLWRMPVWMSLSRILLSAAGVRPRASAMVTGGSPVADRGEGQQVVLFGGYGFVPAAREEDGVELGEGDINGTLGVRSGCRPTAGAWLGPRRPPCRRDAHLLPPGPVVLPWSAPMRR